MSDKLQHPNLWLSDERCLVCNYKSGSVYKPDLLKSPVTLTCYICGAQRDIVINEIGRLKIEKLLNLALELDKTKEKIILLRKKLGYKHPFL